MDHLYSIITILIISIIQIILIIIIVIVEVIKYQNKKDSIIEIIIEMILNIKYNKIIVYLLIF